MIARRVLIAVPTYNRPEIVKYLLSSLSKTIDGNPNLFLGIYDSSDDEETLGVVEPFLSDSITIKRYMAGLSEEKGFDILYNEGPKYDYIWFCSDRKVLKLNRILPLIEEDINRGVDLIFFSKYDIEHRKKSITDRKEMSMQFFEVLNMAKTIIGCRAISHMSQREVFDKYIGSHFSVQASLMDFIGQYSFEAIQYNLRDQDVAKTGSIPFVHEWGNNVVWQWSKSWCDTVDMLPNSFENYKEDIIRTNYMFSFNKVLARRATGNEYRYADLKKYNPYIKRISQSLFPVYIAKCFPVVVIKPLYRVYKMIKTRAAE